MNSSFTPPGDCGCCHTKSAVCSVDSPHAVIALACLDLEHSAATFIASVESPVFEFSLKHLDVVASVHGSLCHECKESIDGSLGW